jgi:hypothetical protein
MAEPTLPRPGGLSEYDNPIGWAAQMYYEAGYRRAIADLRNDEAFVTWMAAQPDGTLYDNENQMTADYLEALLAEG